jgi:hypothetical protein
MLRLYDEKGFNASLYQSAMNDHLYVYTSIKHQIRVHCHYLVRTNEAPCPAYQLILVYKDYGYDCTARKVYITLQQQRYMYICCKHFANMEMWVSEKEAPSMKLRQLSRYPFPEATPNNCTYTQTQPHHQPETQSLE